MIHTVNTGRELYVYMNGELIFKRWIGHGYSMTFHGSEGIKEYKTDAVRRQIEKPTLR